MAQDHPSRAKTELKALKRDLYFQLVLRKLHAHRHELDIEYWNALELDVNKYRTKVDPLEVGWALAWQAKRVEHMRRAWLTVTRQLKQKFPLGASKTNGFAEVAWTELKVDGGAGRWWN